MKTRKKKKQVGKGKEAVWRRVQDQKWNRELAPMLVLCLRKYTYDECLLAVAHSHLVPRRNVGELAHILYCRSGRGDVTLDEAIALYGTHTNR